MKAIRFDTKKFKKTLENFLLSLIERSFLTILLIFLFSLILGFLIFYKYGSNLPSGQTITKEKIEFEEKLYERVLKNWQEREENFQKIDIKEYSNPFK